MQPHQQRVIAEKAELDEKIQKLKAFFETPAFIELDQDEAGRLWDQSEIMDAYSEILGERIAAF